MFEKKMEKITEKEFPEIVAKLVAALDEQAEKISAQDKQLKDLFEEKKKLNDLLAIEVQEPTVQLFMRAGFSLNQSVMIVGIVERELSISRLENEVSGLKEVVSNKDKVESVKDEGHTNSG